MKNLKNTFIENGGYKSSMKDGRSKNSLFYSDGTIKISGLTKERKPKKK